MVVTIRKSKNFEGMFAIYKDGKLFDEPCASEKIAINRIKRYGLK